MGDRTEGSPGPEEPKIIKKRKPAQGGRLFKRPPDAVIEHYGSQDRIHEAYPLLLVSPFRPHSTSRALQHKEKVIYRNEQTGKYIIAKGTPYLPTYKCRDYVMQFLKCYRQKVLPFEGNLIEVEYELLCKQLGIANHRVNRVNIAETIFECRSLGIFTNWLADDPEEEADYFPYVSKVSYTKKKIRVLFPDYEEYFGRKIMISAPMLSHYQILDKGIAKSLYLFLASRLAANQKINSWKIGIREVLQICSCDHWLDYPNWRLRQEIGRYLIPALEELAGRDSKRKQFFTYEIKGEGKDAILTFRRGEQIRLDYAGQLRPK